MQEHETPDSLSFASAARLKQTEAQSDKPEEPLQRSGDEEVPCLRRCEKLRLLILGLALLALLAGLFLDLFSRSVLPLFGVLVLVYLGYRRLDARFSADEANI